MEINIENETTEEFGFDYNKLITTVVEGAIEYINCPYETIVNVTIVDDEAIRNINKEYRKIDKATDVLSFPMVEYEIPGDFKALEEDEYNDCFDPDSGQLILGDIIISKDKVLAQSEEYGHSAYRELGFLVAHSMFHLFGYDHMEEKERIEMEGLQKELLDKLGITRDKDFDSTIKLSKIDADNEVLILKAKNAMNNAYAPYSKYKVGAAIATKTGQIFTGCNIENVSYGATICAERCAALKAISEGYKEFTKIAIVSSSKDFTYPCGICRQFLAEFGTDIKFVLSNNKGEIKEKMLKELLPEAFNM